jgi:hypothetical protein
VRHFGIHTSAFGTVTNTTKQPLTLCREEPWQIEGLCSFLGMTLFKQDLNIFSIKGRNAEYVLKAV